MGKGFDAHDNELILEFKSIEAAGHFKSWLCGPGEQYYWTWMECRETEEDGDITGLNFDYSDGSYVAVKCGRLDKNGEE